MAFPFGFTFPNLFRRTAAPATAVRSLDGGRMGGRRGWGMGTSYRINSEVSGAGATVRTRARYLAANNPWLSQAVANWAGALVGSGIVPTPKAPEAANRKALSDLWSLWTEEADADGRTDFAGMQADIVRGLVIDGEAFVQVLMTEDGPRLRLAGAEGVQNKRTESWHTLGMKYRAWLDFGAGWLDSKAYMNPGA